MDRWIEVLSDLLSLLPYELTQVAGKVEEGDAVAWVETKALFKSEQMEFTLKCSNSH